MQPKVRETLEKPESELHKQMLEHVRKQLKCSREKMSEHYADWDMFDDVYEGRRQVDKQDLKARERKEPEKMVIPLTYAQVQTFIAFAFQQFNQRPNFFELMGTGMEDWKAAKIAEAVLTRDLSYNKWIIHQYQFLLNLAKYGLGVLKHSWFKETQKQWVKSTTQSMPSLSGVQMFPNEQMTLQDVTKFLGTKIDSISPYRFFPDPNLPITRFQDGEFCASEMDVTHMWLRKMERAGLLVGTEFVKDMPSADWEERNRAGLRSGVTYDQSSGKQKGGVILADCQIELIPNEYKLDDGSALGPEDYPIKYVVTIANDNRVVKCQPSGYLHNHYNYVVAQLSPDEHKRLNSGVAELINELQSVVTWLFNSRITSVRKTIQNTYIVDPEGVEMADLAERRPVIRLKKGVSRSGVDRWIQQLPVTDVTQSHISDAQQLGEIIQLVTGINQNALGQYSSGRRSAEQTKAVNSGAASRLKMYCSLIWAQAFQPLGEDMLSNSRDGLDEQQLVRVVGLQLAQPQSPYAVGPAATSQFLGVTKQDLIGNYDFTMLDGTLPTEKGYTSQMLQDILVQIMSNPQAAMLLGLDAKALLTEIAELNNIRNPERFFMQPAQQQMLMQGAQALGMPGLAGPAQSAAGTQATAEQPQNGLDLSALLPGAAPLPQLSI